MTLYEKACADPEVDPKTRIVAMGADSLYNVFNEMMENCDPKMRRAVIMAVAEREFERQYGPIYPFAMGHEFNSWMGISTY